MVNDIFSIKVYDKVMFVFVVDDVDCICVSGVD